MKFIYGIIFVFGAVFFVALGMDTGKMSSPETRKLREEIEKMEKKRKVYEKLPCSTCFGLDKGKLERKLQEREKALRLLEYKLDLPVFEERN